MRTMFSAKSSERTSCRASARRISSHHIASAGCELRMARELGDIAAKPGGVLKRYLSGDRR